MKLELNWPIYISTAVLCASLLYSLSGCSEQPLQPELFPLNPGLTWHYKITTNRASGSTTDNIAIRTLPSQLFNGATYAVRRTSNDTEYLIGHDKEGIYRYAKRTLVNSQPIQDSARRYVLKAPYQLGSTWSHSTPIYLIERQRPGTVDSYRLVHEPPAEMTYQIEAINEQITVAAGQFNRCLKVRGAADITIFVDPDQGFVEIPITTLETYCPGVGLVKLERLEEITSRFYQGGTFKMELIEFDSG